MSKSYPRIAIAMSGGVDSSVAAALLVKEGYEVTGVMLRLWNEPETEIDNRCCSPDSMALARRVAARLDIPFYVIDARQFFHQNVVNYFIDGYTSGITPNPCLFCNKLVRWDYLLNQVSSFGIDLMATGHYARTKYLKETDEYQLLKAIDKSKDQSYVLSFLTQQKLRQTIFPLGELLKEEVRQIARDLKLPSADRPESQDLCFLGDQDYRAFLIRHAPEKIIPGPILSEEGDLLGEHKGLAFYTIGQRRGLGIASLHPLYVIKKDLVQNALIVSGANHPGNDMFSVKKINWISNQHLLSPKEIRVKIRYHSPEIKALISPIEPDHATIMLEFPSREVTPGQIAVFYSSETCLGGGIIE